MRRGRGKKSPMNQLSSFNRRDFLRAASAGLALPFAATSTGKSEHRHVGLSFEWEKKWHIEIEGPEVVIPAYPKLMQQYF